MTAKRGLSYKDAGVDIDAGDDLAKKYLDLMQSTFGPQVVRNDGGFGGMYSLKGVQGLFARKLSDPILVSGADGVGTKLKIAFQTGIHNTVGIDLVAMSVNDVLVQGAEPLFFLDYVATGKVEKDVIFDVVSGVAEGCRQSGCALLGGETAELPGFYADGEYDLAGFAVGLVEKRRLIDGARIEEGNVILGLPSTGLHSNGFSLARKALLEVGAYTLDATLPEYNATVGEVLLRPTKIYVKPVIEAIRSYKKKKPIHGIVHITGGGLIENVPRILPPHLDARIKTSSWEIPPIFDLIQAAGNVEQDEMFRVFNMGIGMILVCSEVSADTIKSRLEKAGQPTCVIGEIVKGTGKTRLVQR